MGYMFVYGLITDSARNCLAYVTSIARIGKDAEGSGRGLEIYLEVRGSVVGCTMLQVGKGEILQLN
jgi:hypothetical protein